MIIDERGKLFGKVNIIDIAVLLIIVLCAAGVYVRFFARDNKTVVQGNEFYYQLEALSIRESSVEGLQNAIGTKFFLSDKGRNDDMGILIDVSSEPSREILYKVDGEPLRQEVPSKFNATLTFKIDGKVNENGYYTSDLKDVGVGSNIMLKSKWITVFGNVTKVYD